LPAWLRALLIKVSPLGLHGGPAYEVCPHDGLEAVRA
jgi:hypothetical protein